MNADTLRAELVRARSELEAIERRSAELARRRELLETFLESGQALLSELDAGCSPNPSDYPSDYPSGSPSPHLPAEGEVQSPLPRKRPAETSPEANQRRLAYRRFTNLVVREALDILSREGCPLSAKEIWSRHGERHHLSSDALYTLLYKRAYHGSLVRNLGGRFWPIHLPVPDEEESS